MPDEGDSNGTDDNPGQGGDGGRGDGSDQGGGSGQQHRGGQQGGGQGNAVRGLAQALAAVVESARRAAERAEAGDDLPADLARAVERRLDQARRRSEQAREASKLSAPRKRAPEFRAGGLNWRGMTDRRGQGRTRRSLLRLGAAGLLGSSAGCQSLPGQGPTTPTATRASPVADARYGYTYVHPDGNPVLDGRGDVRGVEPVEVDVDDRPRWLVALPADEGSLWYVLTKSGTARTVQVVDGTVREAETAGPALSGDAPPLVRQSADGLTRVTPPGEAAARTCPVVTDEGALLYTTADGHLVQRADGRVDRFDVGALSDARIVHLADDRYALLGDRTDRYQHAALGDPTEGGSLVVYDAAERAVEHRTRVGPPGVIEGLAPMVADVDGDGEPELLATVADAENGARLAAFRQDGTRIATGPIYGSGWRHQLCVAPFTGGRPEVAVVLQPHVRQLLEFYQLRGGDLEVVASIDSFSTHTYGSHNPDGAIAGDLDDDGQIEVLLPTNTRDALRAVERTGGAREAWELDPGGIVRSNVTGVSLSDGVAVGVGTDNGVRIWQG